MKAGDIYKPVLTLSDASGNTLAGAAAGFTVASYVNGVLTALTASITEIGAGKYYLSLTLPTTVGTITCFVTHSTGFPSPNQFGGTNTANDIDTVAARLVVPASYIVATTGTLLVDTALTLDSYREQTIAVTVVDSGNIAIPGTGYTNLRMTIRDKRHAGTMNVSITTSVTWDGAGLLTIPIPENTLIFPAIDTAIARGEDTALLYYDVIGDRAGVATQTRPILRGTLTLRRFEGPA